jgi:hypothetical protein
LGLAPGVTAAAFGADEPPKGEKKSKPKQKTQEKDQKSIQKK